MTKPLFLVLLSGLFACNQPKRDAGNPALLLKNVTLIDGSGGAPILNTNLLIRGDTIAAIGDKMDADGAAVLDLSGKTIMPALISAHTHIGTLKDTANKGENYTRENILRQLKKYADYGVTNIQVMGTDRPMLFHTGLRDSSQNGLLPGARLHSAGYGFGVPNGAPPLAMAMDSVFRPASAQQVAAEMDSLAELKPSLVKIWVDDFNRKFPKMDTAIYQAIIKEAHKHHLRVAAHLYYLSDARSLVRAGVDVIAHSIRDSVIDDALIKEMRAKEVAYIPTLSLDEYAYIYARRPEWINDAFFKASLEPGVYEKITSPQYQENLKNAPDYERNVHAFETALKNVEKLYAAGILIAMGTDSGATPVRAQGFSEHLELELMVQAGLKPIAAITAATRNAASVLEIDGAFGTLATGKSADFMILNANPADDIKNTRKIFAVYKAGKLVSNGPLNK
ncbi:amidohydrolase family protein [Chitinophaga sp.]|uniref:amidohydrolase family protein n=1 Tax=Chitinophaga sp. TaxID=1869181 RepID=UPI0031E2FC6E